MQDVRAGGASSGPRNPLVPAASELRREILEPGTQLGAEILTVGGIFGIVQSVDEDDELITEIAEGVHVRVARRAVATVVKADDADADEDEDDEDDDAEGEETGGEAGDDNLAATNGAGETDVRAEKAPDRNHAS